jgi:hypothetical protein
MTREESKVIIRKHTDHLVRKWEKTGLLDGLKDNTGSFAVLLESEPKQYHIDDMTPEEREFSEAMWVYSNTEIRQI